MTDVRRFDFLERVVADERRRLDDFITTVLGRSGAHRPIPVVTSTGQITSPYTGMLILNTTDMLLYRWDGAAWVGCLAVGGTTAATRHEARYESTTTYTINNATDTKLRFHTAITTSDDVTPSGTGNQDFLLNRGGLWRVSVGQRMNANGADEVTAFLSTGTNIVTLTNRFAEQTVSIEGSIAPAMSVSTEIRVAAGTSVFAGLWHNAGVGVGTNVSFGAANHIALTWLRRSGQ